MLGYRDIFFFVPALLLSILTPLFLPSSSVSVSFFVLAVPMRDCLGKHSCMSSPCPIAILNGTFFFSRVEIVYMGWSFVYQNQIKFNQNIVFIVVFLKFLLAFHVCPQNNVQLLIVIPSLETKEHEELECYLPRLPWWHSQYIPFYTADCFWNCCSWNHSKNRLNCNIWWDYLCHTIGYIVIINHLTGISNVALLVPPIVPYFFRSVEAKLGIWR